MSKIRLFPTPEYTCKQPKDSVVPRLPMTGVLLGPSNSGKSTALVSMILEQYRGCFERIYIASASINVDDSWKPVKKYIEETMKVPVDREQVYFEDWDEAALLLENYPHYTCTKSSLFLSLRAVLSQMYIGMKHALLAGTRALHYDTLS